MQILKPQERISLQSECQQLLQKCTVKILQKGQLIGTGFFILPNVLVTCFHVFTKNKVKAFQIGNKLWEGNYRELSVHHLDGLDLVALEILDYEHEYCLPLKTRPPKKGDQLSGYSYNTDYKNGVVLVSQFISEGEHKSYTVFRVDDDATTKGSSGTPLWNESQNVFFGMMYWWKEKKQNTLVIPAAYFESHFPVLYEKNIAFHEREENGYWKRAIAADKCNQTVNQHQGYPKELNLIPNFISARFEGRTKELEQIRTTMPKAQQIVVVNGLGGIGKTTLAREFVRLQQGDYDHILWLEINKPTDEDGRVSGLVKSLVDDLVLLSNLKIAADINTLKKDQKYQQGFDLILNQLKQLQGEKLLVIDDNINTQITPNTLKKISSLCPDWQILLLTRQRLHSPFTHSLEEIGFLEEQASIALFQQRCATLAKADIQAFFEVIDRHPLLILLIASLLETANGLVQPSDIITALEERNLSTRNMNMALGVENSHQTQEASLKEQILCVFNLANFNALEQHLLRHFAILPLQAFNTLHLALLLQHPLAQMTELTQHLNQLYKKGWLKKDNTPTLATFQTYRFIQKVCLLTFEPDPVDYDPFLNSIFRLFHSNDLDDLVALLPAPFKEETDFPSDEPVIIELQENKDLLLKTVALFEDLDESRQYIHLLKTVAHHYKNWGNFDKAMEYYKYYVDGAKELNLATATFIVEAYYFIIHTSLKAVNLQQARVYLNDFKFFIENQAGQGFEDRAEYNYLEAFFHKTCGQFQIALDYALKSVAVWEAVNNTISLATGLNLIGLIYQNLGQYKEAKKLYEKVINIQEIHLGKKHPNTAISYNNLALVLSNLGQYEEAKKLCEKATNIQEIHFGKKHPTTATSYNNLALVLKDLGQYEEAKKLCEKAINIKEIHFGKKHPNTAISYNNLALVLSNLGQYEEAKKLCEKAINIQEIHFGKKHPNTTNSYNNLALVLSNLGQYEEAKKLCEKAINIKEIHFGKKHPNIANSYNNLAVVLQSLGQYEEAKKLCEEAINFQEIYFGRNHPDTTRSYGSLAVVLQHLEQYEEAKKLYEKAINFQEIHFGRNHPETARSYGKFAVVLQHLEQYEEAISLLKKAYTIFLNQLGSEHPHTIVTTKALTFLQEKITQSPSTN